MTSIKENEKQRAEFVNGLLALALANGVNKAKLKREAFSSYATGNRRIEHHHDELTLTDIFNIAAICRISPAQMIQKAAENMTAKKK